MARRCKDCPEKVESKEIQEVTPTLEGIENEKERIFSFPRFNKTIKAKTLEEAREKLKMIVSYKNKEL